MRPCNQWMGRLAILLLLIGTLQQAQAQRVDAIADTTKTVRVVLQDGTELVGVITAVTPEDLTVRSRSGRVVTVNRAEVARVEREDTITIGGRAVRLDPNRTRLLFSPTARSLEKGQGYFADYYLFFPFVGVGVGSGINLAGGISLFPASAQLLYLAPKVTVYERDGAGIAVGTLLATFVGNVGDDNILTGLFYGVGTLGHARTAGTLGLGFGMVEGEFSSKPVIMVGGEHQVSGNVKLILENYLIFPEEGSLLVASGGIRFFGARLAADLGLVTSPDLIDETDGFPFVPFLSFAYNFGTRR